MPAQIWAAWAINQTQWTDLQFSCVLEVSHIRAAQHGLANDNIWWYVNDVATYQNSYIHLTLIRTSLEFGTEIWFDSHWGAFAPVVQFMWPKARKMLHCFLLVQVQFNDWTVLGMSSCIINVTWNRGEISYWWLTAHVALYSTWCLCFFVSLESQRAEKKSLTLTIISQGCNILYHIISYHII